ncbi:MAG: preprotein translocase subunit YajC [Kiritimatiellae bacterium]|nr:preprotein translocase subunit YajC [Kiritimatiellia bacterium]
MNSAIMFCDAAPAAAPAATATEVQCAKPAPGAAQQAPQQGGMGMLVPMLLILAIFYFMMIRPQQRKEKERRQMIDELRAGAKIVFAGGLMGTIVEATEKTFKVEIAPGTVIEIARSCVTGVVPSAEAETKK